MNFLKSPLSSLLHLLFPENCCGCGINLSTEKGPFCFWCEASMPLTRFEYFPNNTIEKIFRGRSEILAASANMYFTTGSPLQKSMHKLKYKGRKDIGLYFGRQMGKALCASGRFKDCELIIPLPLFPEREKKRGYNQSAVIADAVSIELNIPVRCDAVSRIKKTETQTHKNRIERWRNMEASFEIRNMQMLSGKHILLIDDIITTGASLEACAGILLKTPGVKLSIACLAHTVSA
jgi:ComF family protein